MFWFLCERNKERKEKKEKGQLWLLLKYVHGLFLGACVCVPGLWVHLNASVCATDK